MANTGNLVTVTLVSVRTDITDPSDPHYQETLDVNGVPTRISGAAPLTKTNTYTDPDYIAPYQNLASCPV